MHIFSNPSDNGTMNGKALTERFELTDRALEEMPTWPNVRYLTTYAVFYMMLGDYGFIFDIVYNVSVNHFVYAALLKSNKK